MAYNRTALSLRCRTLNSHQQYRTPPFPVPFSTLMSCFNLTYLWFFLKIGRTYIGSLHFLLCKRNTCFFEQSLIDLFNVLNSPQTSFGSSAFIPSSLLLASYQGTPPDWFEMSSGGLVERPQVSKLESLGIRCDLPGSAEISFGHFGAESALWTRILPKEERHIQ